MDLVTGNRAPDGGTVSVLLGIGDGTFQPEVRYRMSASPSFGVALGDVNGDAEVDVVTANFGDHVTVLLGHGDGTFQPFGEYPVKGQPRGIVMSDLNGDGNQDVVTANNGGNTVGVLLGNGTGAYSTVVSYDVSFNPGFVVAGDLTGDGVPDLAVANNGATVVSILPGVGDGTFGPRMDFQASRNPSGLAIGDLDGDGRPDLVSANVLANTVSILRNIGSGGSVTAVEPIAVSRGSWARVSPNPIRSSAALMFRTARPGTVEVRLFDVRGRLVRTIAIPTVPRGTHGIEIDGRDASGRLLGAGVYFYSLQTADGITRGRFAVLK
jgi:hypothetical protein